MFKFFDYYCPACHAIREKMVKDHEKDNQKCSECEHPVERKVAAPAGSGNAAHGFLPKGKAMFRGGNHAK